MRIHWDVMRLVWEIIGNMRIIRATETLIHILFYSKYIHTVVFIVQQVLQLCQGAAR
jgi:hypothetical protein